MSIKGHDIESFKSVINRRGGVARQNQFLVYMQLPLLSINISQIASSIIGGNAKPKQIFNNPRDIAFLCESCSIPGRSVATTEYATWHQPVKRPYGFINEDVSFSFILTQDYFAKRMFDEWQSNIMDFEHNRLKYLDEFVADVTIIQLNTNGTPIYSVKLQKAYPIAVSAIELSSAGENTVQKLTVTLTYENLGDKSDSLIDVGKEIKDGLLDSIKNIGNIFNF